MADQQVTIDNPEALKTWVREQFQRANKHLAEQGVLFETVVMEESRYMAPHIAVWKIKDTQQKFFWVICGDLPADAVTASVAANARDALKHFSMSWQLKAEKILSSETADEQQQDYAKLLGEKAELLYEVQANENWWQES
jgi:hypothetical protein